MPDASVSLLEVARRVNGHIRGDRNTRVCDVSHDSRRSDPGSLFAAIRGRQVDGHIYVGRAAELGAPAALVEEFLPLPLPQIRVADTRLALGPASSLVHGDPSRKLDVVGVTGTNGKTTVTVMLESVATVAGRQVARLGTLGTRIAGREEPLALTTPEASELQRLFGRMVAGGISLVAMEVSSHSLALNRVDSTSFAVGAFTNLSQEHLDFHGDMEGYFTAKRRLFDGRASVHVIDVTTSAGQLLAESTTGTLVTVGYGGGHDVGIMATEPSLSGSRFVCRLDGVDAAMSIKPGGLHNIRNAALAAGCAHALGMSVDEIVEGLGAVDLIPGRLERVDAGQPFEVIVDYAHTPSAVESVVGTALDHCQGSVIVVLGAAGDRDAAKRPLLGAAAARAHMAVITSDNPRSEDPSALVEQVVAGTSGGRAEVVAEADRSKAILLGLQRARPGDAVLILGKGHERYQDLGAEVVPFDDRAVATLHLRRHGVAHVSSAGAVPEVTP